MRPIICFVGSALLFVSMVSAGCGSDNNGNNNSNNPQDAGSGGTDAGGGTDSGLGGGDAGGTAATWTAAGLDGSIVVALEIDRKNQSTVFAGLSAGGAEKGLWRTKDAGKNWTKLAGGLPDRFFGAVAISPVTNIVYANPGAEGLWHSNNGGDTWTQSTSWLTDPGGVSGLLCHPTMDITWTLSSQNGVFRSNNGGVSFTKTPNTNLPLNQFVLGPLAFDGSKLYLGTYGKGIWVSADSGDSWTQTTSTNLPTTGAVSEVINLAASASRPGVLFVKTGGGLFKSIDSAATFTPITPGPIPRYTGLRLDPDRTSTLFVTVNENSGDPGGLVQSTDDAQTWKKIGPDFVPANMVDVATDGTIYLGTVGKGVWIRR